MSIIIGAVVLSIMVASGTNWYLSLNKSTEKTKEIMEAQSYAYNEWQLVLAENYDDVADKARANVSDKFDIGRKVGAEKTVSSSGKEKDVTITVYKKGSDNIAYALQSGKAKPTMDNYYTKAEIDSKVASLNAKDTSLQNQINSLSSKFSSYYTKSQIDSLLKNNSGSTVYREYTDIRIGGGSVSDTSIDIPSETLLQLCKKLVLGKSKVKCYYDDNNYNVISN